MSTNFVPPSSWMLTVGQRTNLIKIQIVIFFITVIQCLFLSQIYTIETLFFQSLIYSLKSPKFILLINNHFFPYSKNFKPYFVFIESKIQNLQNFFKSKLFRLNLKWWVVAVWAKTILKVKFHLRNLFNGDVEVEDEWM